MADARLARLEQDALLSRVGLTTTAKYGGEPHESFHDVARNIMNAANVADVDERRAVLMIPFFLKGRALDVFNSLPDNQRFNNFDATMGFFQQALNLGAYSDVGRDMLDSLKRQSQESLRELAKRVKQLVRAAHTDFTDEQAEKEAVRHFIMKLTMPMRNNVRRFEPETLEEAILLAEREEFMMKDNDSEINTITEKLKTTALENRVASLTETIEKQQKRQQELEKKFNKSKQENNWFRGNGNWRGRFQRRSYGRPPWFAHSNFRGNYYGGRGGYGYGQNPRGYNHRGGYGGRGGSHVFNINEETVDDINAVPQEDQPSSSRGSPSWNKFLFFIVCLFFLPGTQAATRTLNDCLYTTNEYAIVPPKIPTCTIPLSASMPKTFFVDVFHKNHVVHRTEAIVCTKYDFQLCTTGILKLWGRTEISERNASDVSEELCKEVNSTRKYEGAELKKNDKRDINEMRFMTEMSTETTTPWFGTNCETRSIFILETAEIHTNDGRSLLSTVGDLAGCSPSDGSCKREGKITVWNGFHIEATCFHERVEGLHTVTQFGENILFHETLTVETIDHVPLSEEERRCVSVDAVRLSGGFLIKTKNDKSRYVREAAPAKAPHNNQTVTEEMAIMDKVLKDKKNLDLTPEDIRVIALVNEYNLARLKNESERYQEQNRRYLKNMWTMQNDTDKDISRLNNQVSNLSRLLNNITNGNTGLIGLQTDVASLKESILKQLTDFGSLRNKVEKQQAEWTVKMETLKELLSKASDNNSSALNVPAHAPQNISDEVTEQIQKLETRMKQWFTTESQKHDAESRTLIGEMRNLSDTFDVKQGELNSRLNDLTATLQTAELTRSDDITNKAGSSLVMTFMTACLSQRSQLQSTHVLLEASPTKGMRQLLGRSDIVARPAGDGAYMVAKCRQVEVDEKDIYETFMYNNTCYDRWPVIVDKKLAFVQPATREIERAATVTNCRDKPILMSKVNNEWKYSGRKGPAPNSLSATRIALERRITEHGRRSRFTQSTFNWFSTFGKSVYTTSQSIVKSATERLEHAANKTTEAVKIAYEKTKTVLIDTIKTLWAGIKWVLLFIVLPGLGIAILVAMCVLQAKIWFIRKSTSGITEGLKSIGKLTPTLTKSRKTVRVNAIEDDQSETEMEELNHVRVEQPPPRPGAFKPKFSFVPLAIALIAPVVSSSPMPTGNKIPFIPVHLNGMPVVSLFDTGSSITYARQSTLQRIGNIPMGPSNRTARAANGTSINFLGTSTVMLSFGKNHIMHDVLVSDDNGCPAAMLFGTDVMKSLAEKKHHIQLNFTENTVKIGNETVRMLQAGEKGYDTGAIFTIKADREIVLKPRSDNVVVIKSNVSFPTETELLVESRAPNENFVIARSLCNAHEGNKLSVRIMNPTTQKIVIKKGQEIAHAEIIDDRLYETNTVYSVERPTYVSPETDWERHLPERAISQKSFEEFMDDKLNLEKSVLTPEQKETLRAMILKYQQAFVGPDGRIGHYKGKAKHSIPLKPNSVPIRRFYRVPLQQRNEVESQIKELMEQGIIRPSESPFCSPVVLVKKKDANTWRFTVDYRGVNNVTQDATYILPLITDIIDVAAGKAVYTVADMKSAYFQIDMKEEDIQKTAFGTHVGLYEFLRMPMGLTGAPGTFQRIMETVKRQIQAAALVYLDDIVIMSENNEQHLKDVEELLETLIRNGLKVRLDKTTFAQNKVKYLGYEISNEGIAVDPSKTKIIDKFPTPRSLTDVKSFLGMVNYFRRFIPKFAEIATPLTELSKKDVPFDWNDKVEEAFQKLKGALSNAPVLKAAEAGKPYTLETDASGVAIAGVLLQGETKAEQHPISFFSRRLNIHERNYAALEIEALAIAASCEYFRQYISGAKTTVVTDHRPLITLLQKKDLTGRLAKYQLTIQEYNLDIVYRPGRENSVADTLSRYPPTDDTITAVDSRANAKLSIQIPSREEVVAEQKRCQWISEKLAQLQLRGEASEDKDEIFMAYNGILYVKPSNQTQQPRIVIPEDSKFIDGIILYFHNHAHLGAHLDGSRTLAKIERAYFWKTCKKDTQELVRTCASCQKRKVIAAHIRKEPLGSFPVPSVPFERIHLDVLGALPQTASGMRYILCMVCSFSKFAVTVALPNQKAETTAQALVENLICVHGIPEVIVSDQGRNFIADVFVQVCNRLGSKVTTSTPYHHQSNGQVERFNRTIEEVLTMFVDQTRSDWDKYPPLITFAYNGCPHATTKMSPFEVIYGRTPLVPEDLHQPTPRWRFDDAEEYHDFLSRHLSLIWDKVREKIEVSQKDMKERYDKRRGGISDELKIGQSVLLKKENPKNKIDFTWTGPWKIREIHWPNVDLEDGRKRVTVHLNRVKLWKERKVRDDNLDESNSEAED